MTALRIPEEAGMDLREGKDPAKPREFLFIFKRNLYNKIIDYKRGKRSWINLPSFMTPGAPVPSSTRIKLP
jgi:hypothetical protein